MNALSRMAALVAPRGQAPLEVAAASLLLTRGLSSMPAHAAAPAPALKLPPFDHVPAPYTGPSAEEVLALRKQHLSPCEPPAAGRACLWGSRAGLSMRAARPCWSRPFAEQIPTPAVQRCSYTSRSPS